MSVQHPIVSDLRPSYSLTDAHHGPHGRAAAAGAASKPRYFKNPWPSYRTPSLSDAYTAYQNGAAIALPVKASRMADVEEGTPLVTRTNGNGRLPARVWVRPDLREFGEEDEDDDWRDPPVQVVEPSWGEGEEEDVTWLGHAGVMVRIPWKGKERAGKCGVVFDPIFSYRCSPSQYVGPARYLDSPCRISDLPAVHVCCISHDHYDHLDYYTIIDLWKYHSSTIHFFVPLGLKQWFISSGIPSERITELDWWHESLVTFPSSSASTEQRSEDVPVGPDTDLTLKIAFTPAQHRSGRGLLDHMTTLWGSWCVGVVDDEDASKARQQGMKDWKGFRMFFGGDTGYRYASAPEDDTTAICPAFQEIADLYSPMTLSFLPISTGSSLPFIRTVLSLSLDQYVMTSSQHCSPDDALAIHEILKSQRTVAVHWGTFCDGDEARGTRVEFGRARRRRGVGSRWGDEGDERKTETKGRFVCADIGQTLVLPLSPK
ncbi:beta-lactamase superfamily domain-domain-containing protein [Naematelia encephala]|uniref:Beta-lactamase superfamily domain-domain-containing protein n=1 Tax=Naematelia encephala TaxID=71784 RepID=A0A1Y2BGX4_9TREE|nr:beta-lactamase superfamily domain-domain-containing protein [Naematelia encephala]